MTHRPLPSPSPTAHAPSPSQSTRQLFPPAPPGNFISSAVGPREEHALTSPQHHPSCANLPSVEPSLPSHSPSQLQRHLRANPIPIGTSQRHCRSSSLHPTSHWHRCLHPTVHHQPNHPTRLHWCRQQGLVRRCRSLGRRWSRCRPLSDWKKSGQLLDDGYGRTILHLLDCMLTTRHGKRFISRSCNSLA